MHDFILTNNDRLQTPLRFATHRRCPGRDYHLERRQKLSEVTKGSHFGDACVITLARLKALKAGRRVGMDSRWGSWLSIGLGAATTHRRATPALIVETEFPALNRDNIPTIRTLLS